MSKGEGGERPAAGNAAAGAPAIAPGDGGAAGCAPHPRASLCGARALARHQQVQGGRMGQGPVAPAIGVTVCLFSHLGRGFLFLGGHEVDSNDSLKESKSAEYLYFQNKPLAGD